MFVVPALLWLNSNSWALWKGQREQEERYPSTGQEEIPSSHWPGPSTPREALLIQLQASSPRRFLNLKTMGRELQVRIQPWPKGSCFQKKERTFSRTADDCSPSGPETYLKISRLSHFYYDLFYSHSQVLVIGTWPRDQQMRVIFHV